MFDSYVKLPEGTMKEETSGCVAKVQPINFSRQRNLVAASWLFGAFHRKKKTVRGIIIQKKLVNQYEIYNGTIL
jgi:hypothetical protein